MRWPSLVFCSGSTLQPTLLPALRGTAPSSGALVFRHGLLQQGRSAGAFNHSWSHDGRRTHAFLCCAAAQTLEEASASLAKIRYEAVIGIECHVQLNTASKAFCGCANRYGAPPNTHVCPICLGHPGALPVANAEVVAKGIAAGLALGCAIAPSVQFDRKQYLYPDLPKGYQISQHKEPLASGGAISVAVPGGGTKRVRITRAHLEEDAGKLVHAGADQLTGSSHSLVDFNRAGVPLLEIVSEPDLSSGTEAAAYGAELRRIAVTLGISDGNMQDGALRCDVNVSVRPEGTAVLGTKVEVKNMNSFSAMRAAIDFEIARQSELVEAGGAGAVAQETRLFDETRGVTYSMRSKEGLADYRYFPEPDLPPLAIECTAIEAARAALPELPAARRARYEALGLSPADAVVLADEASVGAYFDAALAAGAPLRAAANWVMGDLTAHCKEARMAMGDLALQPETLADMLRLIESDAISGKIGKVLLPDLLKGMGRGGVAALVAERGLAQISNPGALEAIVDSVLEANPKQLAQFRAGKAKLQGYFIGQVMKESRGRANPTALQELLMRKLRGEV